MPLDVLQNGTASLAHRGPDDAGFHRDGPWGFGFRRLAILDLSPAGHQPMSSGDGMLTVVFNGEIYNYVEIRQELAGLGHTFRSQGDTEVLLAAYREWGEDCVHRFNGMFAFLIHDRRTGAVFGARDRLGVKPLYWWQDDDWVVLASEPNAIAATGLVRFQPDWSRVADAMRSGTMDDGDGCCLREVHTVPAAHTLRVDAQGSLTLRRYWQLPEAESAGRDESQWVDELSALASDAVRLRLRSDVPVGFTLSGGIDSSLLICEAAAQGDRHGGLRAFSYQDPAHDETGPIRDTVAQTGATLVSLDSSELDIARHVREVVQANGEPVHSTSAVANHALFGLARRHGVTVLLGGQGADEVFGGYRDFQWNYWHSLFCDGRWAGLLSDVRAYARVQGESAFGTFVETLSRSLRIAVSTSPAYRRWRGHRAAARNANAVHALFAPELLSLATAPALECRDFTMARAQRHAASAWPLPMYLRIEDRVSMAHSVEARLPFTDYRLVEHAFRMPDALKFAGGLNKRALRMVAQRRVPSSVTSRVRKLGFPVADSHRAAAGLHTLCRELAGTRGFAERGIYDLRAVRRLLDRAPQPQDVDPLFHLAQMEIWLDGLGARRAA